MMPPTSAIMHNTIIIRNSLQLRGLHSAFLLSCFPPNAMITALLLHLTRQMDSLAPPTQPTRPEKKRLKPRVMTE